MQNEVTLKSARKDKDEGIERVNKARRKLTGLKSCWYDAYQGHFPKCSDITTADDNERRKTCGWDLSNCFQKESGRHPFPACHTKSPTKNYQQFFLETNSICHRSNYIRHQTEKLVNQLVISANYAKEKLDTIEENSKHLLQDSKDIHDSWTKIDRETQQVAQTCKNVSNEINGVLKQSELVFEQSLKIATSQSNCKKGKKQ
uniref:Uncharacterized protein n=1 Tax=Quercus lobata TaxID=97700 RepID=A0A7N2R959_QUELO